MTKVVGIKFKKTPKIYYFEPNGLTYNEADAVIVETARGIELGFVVMPAFEVEDSQVVQPLKPVIRIANKEDIEKNERLEKKHDETMKICASIIDESGLNMKLVDVEYTFDEAKLIVHFSADGRVDFRELVKKLASAFRTRIELRQIGARDECRMIGGLGPCGRVCCCKAHLNDYTHVSIKMAKNQSLSLNPVKISGLCGRLMCCLEYENQHYVETNKRMPKLGASVGTSDGRQGIVIGLNQLKELVRLKITEKDKDVVTIDELPLNEIIFKGKTNIEALETEDTDDEVALKDLE